MPVDLMVGASAFKAIYDSAKALKDINDATVRNAAVIELQEKILTAQEAQSALVDRIRELEEEMRGFKTWEAEKQRYELKDLGWGTLAYMLKPAMRGAEPPHWVCANCFAKGQASIIQYINTPGRGFQYSCPACKTPMNPSGDALSPNGAKWLDEADETKT